MMYDATVAVRSVIAKRVFYRRHHGEKGEQKMAVLSTARITAAPPFTFTGSTILAPLPRRTDAETPRDKEFYLPASQRPTRLSWRYDASLRDVVL